MTKTTDRLTLLTTFARVAALGSLSAAGRDLGLSQPSVTRHIDGLETLLGTTLLRRTPHSVTLTPAGEAALADARALLAAWEGFADRHGESGSLAGELRVFVPVALGQTLLADAAATFQARYPGISLDWRLTDGRINLVSEAGDCWIRVGQVPDDRLIVRPLAEIVRRAVIVPGADRERMIALDDFETKAPILTDERGRVLKPRATVVFRTNNFIAAYRQLRAGAGFCILPDWYVREDLAAGILRELEPGFLAPALTLSVAFPPGRRPARLEAFLDHMTEAAGQLA